MSSLVLEVPIRVDANARGHSRFPPRVNYLGERVPFRTLIRAFVGQALKKHRQLVTDLELGPGLQITLTRIAPRELDSHDNLRTSLKPVADGVTDALGLKNDRDRRLSWAYAQGPRGVRVYAVEVKVCARADAPHVTCPRCGGTVPVPEVGA